RDALPIFFPGNPPFGRLARFSPRFHEPLPPYKRSSPELPSSLLRPGSLADGTVGAVGTPLSGTGGIIRQGSSPPQPLGGGIQEEFRFRHPRAVHRERNLRAGVQEEKRCPGRDDSPLPPRRQDI